MLLESQNDTNRTRCPIQEIPLATELQALHLLCVDSRIPKTSQMTQQAHFRMQTSNLNAYCDSRSNVVGGQELNPLHGFFMVASSSQFWQALTSSDKLQPALADSSELQNSGELRRALASSRKIQQALQALASSDKLWRARASSNEPWKAWASFETLTSSGELGQARASSAKLQSALASSDKLGPTLVSPGEL